MFREKMKLQRSFEKALGRSESIEDIEFGINREEQTIASEQEARTAGFRVQGEKREDRTTLVVNFHLFYS